MILYKYASFSAAKGIIENNSIGFTCLEDLNDPFECTALGFLKEDSSVPYRVVYGSYKNRFSRKYALLSLSELPLNPLMWAHYGDSFQGIVIGIDAEKAGFTSSETSVIPAQHGGIEYIKEKKTLGLIPDADELMQVGEDSIGLDAHENNLLRRAFLYKSSDWEYEQEVRIVKNISSCALGYHSGEGAWSNKSGCWNKRMINGKPLYCYQLPRNSIVEVILGAQVYRNTSRINLLNDNELRKLISDWKMKFKVSVSEADVLSWKLESKPHEFPR